ncbi:hypothetical protein AUC43_13780 [Hymenobacter sedentarius]|uniref:Right handed beta helix domain-containing protein n=1 Tax=Hymenobacter sedentarius TaxID=1411621 RepID=A0A0U4C4X3_9BACT|nr:T9SS type A sorting domain-containing protein [Hymenobacter sedentarius]ALW86066.1 hypothetical protein AUC43_13780 [Hymenobacter sedentarius]
MRAETYYISPTGNDGQTGTSIGTAWRTIDKVNTTAFQPGDRILFEGGQTFQGGIWLHNGSQGTPTKPLVVSSYGSGRATISSGNSFGFYAPNTAGIELSKLVFVGAGRLSSTNSGVIFTIDADNAPLAHLRLESLDVSGYRNSGIIFGSDKATSGYSDVRITDCQLHANGEAGLSSYQPFPLAGQVHRNWYVGNCQAYDNPGRADVTNTHTGNGIVLAGIDGVLIEHCVAHDNGRLNANPSGGPVGIWGWACNNLVIQLSESYNNKSGTALDGGGFDLDGGCTNSVMQYNYSHDNQGAGYLLAQFGGAAPMHDLTIRYNISENDARGHNQGALELWSSGDNGGIQRANIYNNTVLLTPPADGTRPKAVYIASGGFSDLSLRNNVLQTTGGLPVVSTLCTASLRLEGNCYWSTAEPLVVEWNGSTYTDLQAWRTATTQEQLSAGRTTGLNADPQLSNLSAVVAPLATSPVLAAGIDLQAEFNISPGVRDFMGNPMPQAPARGNIGAFESASAVAAPLPVTLSAFTAEQQGAAALLRWSTASEKNNAYFEVERSTDGRMFSPLGQVPGNGTSAQLHAYQYTDLGFARYATTTVYYRLRQVDTDGKAAYSPVRALSGIGEASDKAGRLQVCPNPAQASSTIVVKGGLSSEVALFDVRGRQVAKACAGADGAALLRVEGLAAGIYIVRSGAKCTRLTIEK